MDDKQIASKMQSPPSPPRYEDIVYVTKDNEKKEETSQQASSPVPATDSSLVGVALNVLNTVTHFLLGAVVFCTFVIANKTQGVWYYGPNFTSHIYFCVIGYVILMSQAILSFNPHGGWAHGFKYPQKRMIHVVMQVSGSILALFGCFLKLVTGYASGSVHAVFGWMAMLLTIFSLIGGIINYKYTEKISQTRYKNAHSYLGLSTLTMAFISICKPFGYPAMFDDDSSRDLAISVTVFALLGVLISGFIMIKNKTFK